MSILNHPWRRPCTSKANSQEVLSDATAEDSLRSLMAFICDEAPTDGIFEDNKAEKPAYSRARGELDEVRST